MTAECPSETTDEAATGVELMSYNIQGRISANMKEN